MAGVAVVDHVLGGRDVSFAGLYLERQDGVARKGSQEDSRQIGRTVGRVVHNVCRQPRDNLRELQIQKQQTSRLLTQVHANAVWSLGAHAGCRLRPAIDVQAQTAVRAEIHRRRGEPGSN